MGLIGIRFFAALVLWSVAATAAIADEGASADKTAGSELDPALFELLQVLEAETELATKTKMNVDFVPGMVTVLHGKDLLGRGVRSVTEAMELIPGVEVSIATDGQRQFLVRGIGKTFASGKLKILLDGVSLNTAIVGVPNYAIMPIEQVERIEFVRGPGAAVYGEYAYAGVLNVISRKDGRDVYARASDAGWGTAGGVVSHRSADNEFGISLNLAGNFSDGGEVQAGEDFIESANANGVSLSPGPSNEKEQLESAILTVDYRGYRASLQYLNYEHGDFFGVNNALPPPEQQLVRTRTTTGVQLEKDWTISDATTTGVTLGWLTFDLATSGQTLFPPRFRDNPLNPTVAYPNGVIGAPHYEEDKYYLNLEATHKLNARHMMLLGLEYSDTQQGETYQERNFDPNTLNTLPGELSQIPFQRFSGDDNWMGENQQRRLTSVVMQDEMTASERLRLTLGLRHDSYSDVGSRTSPRIAGVYSLAEESILKLQYSEAFRPPTFLERTAKNNPVLAGNPDIEPEEIQMIEGAYIFNNNIQIFRGTLFYSELDNLIVQDTATRRYENKQNTVKSYGLELEYVRPLAKRWKLDFNATVLHAEDKETSDPLEGVADTLSNLALFYQPSTHYSFVMQYRYVGDRSRDATDSRDDLEGYQTVDLTFSAFRVPSQGITLRLGVKNAFDEDVYFAAPVNTYPDDYPRPGRVWWGSVGVDF